MVLRFFSHIKPIEGDNERLYAVEPVFRLGGFEPGSLVFCPKINFACCLSDCLNLS